MKANIWFPDEWEVGLSGFRLTIDTGLLEFEDKDHREEVRVALATCFKAIHDDTPSISFSDECPDCGMASTHSENCAFGYFQHVTER